MALHPSGLGKGLEALIRETHEERESGGIQTLPLSALVPNPRQPRKRFTEKSLEELAASIKSQGLLQPILVRPLGPAQAGKYEIVAGERRWRACQLAGLTEVPVMIKALSSQETLAAALIENLQREDLNPLEEALGLQMLKEEFGLSQDDLAQKIGKSRSAIANSLRLLSLPESVRPLLADGKISSGHARALLSVTDPRAQEYLKNLILENALSVREAEGLAAGWKESGKFAIAGLTAEGVLEQPSPKKDAEQTAEKHSPARGMPQSARILEIQNRMGELFQIPVKVTGKETKGRISFSYNSKAELESLLERLSHAVLEGEARTALPARTQSALEGQSNLALDGAEYPRLEEPAKEKLEGLGMTSLEGSEHAALQGSKAKQLSGTINAVLESRERPALRQSETSASESNAPDEEQPSDSEATDLQSSTAGPEENPVADTAEENPDASPARDGNAQAGDAT